jgi:hypothetical protein
VSRNPAWLAPDVRAAWEAHLSAAAMAGISVATTFTRRTDEEQWALWLQGRRELEEVNDARLAAGLPAISRAENARKVTNCDGKTTRSKHQDGLAYDLGIMGAKGSLDWNPPRETLVRLGELGESVGLEWGGRWAPLDARGIGWDPWHFQRREA